MVGRFIKNQTGRFLAQSPCQHDTLLLAAGKLYETEAAHVNHAGLFHGSFGYGNVFRIVPFRNAFVWSTPHKNDIFHAQIKTRPMMLCQDSDLFRAFFIGKLPYIFISHENLSCRRFHNTIDTFQQCTLSAPIRPD